MSLKFNWECARNASTTWWRGKHVPATFATRLKDVVKTISRGTIHKDTDTTNNSLSYKIDQVFATKLFFLPNLKKYRSTHNIFIKIKLIFRWRESRLYVGPYVFLNQLCLGHNWTAVAVRVYLPRGRRAVSTNARPPCARRPQENK
jgi:hypothetical protein